MVQILLIPRVALLSLIYSDVYPWRGNNADMNAFLTS